MDVVLVLLLILLGVGLLVAGAAVIGGLGPALVVGGASSLTAAVFAARGVNG